MLKSIAKLAAVAIVPAASLLVSSPAHADASACGFVDLRADASCEVVVEGGCAVKCEPVSFTAACAADLYAQCDGSCTGSATVECTGGCQASCEAECKVDPGSFDCNASCRADCSAGCDAQCGASTSKADCAASCEATCSGECSAQCDVTPAMADCTAQCQSCCSGSCNAEANFDCQIECQAGGYVDCRADLQGGCEAQCSKPEGALFCNGQYVDVGERFEECLDYIETQLQIDVKGYAKGSAECEGNTCKAEAKAGVSCAMAPASDTPIDWRALGLAALGVGVFVTRRKR
jgi:hypothetical protein